MLHLQQDSAEPLQQHRRVRCSLNNEINQLQIANDRPNLDLNILRAKNSLRRIYPPRKYISLYRTFSIVANAKISNGHLLKFALACEILTLGANWPVEKK
uniref:Uncharacterized protein n=1 Tax=Romanomermis culicivorax TaxID=13658 RepID=A0A915JSU9_ROMCU